VRKKVDLDHDKLPDPVADAFRTIEKHLQDNDKRFEILFDKHEICLTEDIRDEQQDLEDLFKK
jgi:serine O-acetyltransferase